MSGDDHCYSIGCHEAIPVRRPCPRCSVARPGRPRPQTSGLPCLSVFAVRVGTQQQGDGRAQPPGNCRADRTGEIDRAGRDSPPQTTRVARCKGCCLDDTAHSPRREALGEVGSGRGQRSRRGSSRASEVAFCPQMRIISGNKRPLSPLCSLVPRASSAGMLSAGWFCDEQPAAEADDRNDDVSTLKESFQGLPRVAVF